MGMVSGSKKEKGSLQGPQDLPDLRDRFRRRGMAGPTPRILSELIRENGIASHAFSSIVFHVQCNRCERRLISSFENDRQFGPVPCCISLIARSILFPGGHGTTASLSLPPAWFSPFPLRYGDDEKSRSNLYLFWREAVRNVVPH